jgi:thiosulfate reductase/polysulfide reductase chain A
LYVQNILNCGIVFKEGDSVAKKISRRTFLQLSGATAAAFTTMCYLPEMTLWATDKTFAGSEEFVRTYCEMCTTRCPVQAKVIKGKTVMVTGNPDWRATGGTVCARGAAAVSMLYDKQLLQKPLLRAGERGAGQWKEVSWDEAYEFVVKKMTDIKVMYGPEAVAFACRDGPYRDLFFNLAHAYGSPNTFTHNAVCPLARNMAQALTFGTGAMGIDYANSKYIISLGRSYFEAINVAHARGVMTMIQNGGKLVYLDPRFSITSAKAHEWLPIKPGTDLAFVLALINVLIKENLYDREFVEKYTFGFDAVKESVKEYTPEWAAKETDIKAEDIVRIAREMANAKPRAVVDWGWNTTITPAELDLRRASMIATMLLGSFEVPGGYYLNKGAGMINSLAGKSVVPALRPDNFPPYPNMAARLDGAGIKGNPYGLVPPSSGIVHMIPEAILTGKPYQVKGWYVHRHNPVISHPNSNRVIESIKKLDLLVVSDIYLTDTAMWADVILPECTFLERDEGFMPSAGLTLNYTLRQKVIEPLHDTKPHWQIFKDLGERMGLGDYFPYEDVDDMRRKQVGGSLELVRKGKEQGFISFDMKPFYLRDKASVADFVKRFPDAAQAVNEEGIIDRPILNMHTPSKKIELVSNVIEDSFAGRGVPSYKRTALKEENQLYFVQGKTAIHTNAHTHNVPHLYELMPKNRLWINPVTAKRLNLKDNDRVEVTSKDGKEFANILISEGVRPDSAFCYFGFGRISPGLKRAYKQGTNSNMLIPTIFADMCGVAVFTAGIDIKKV